MPRPARTPPTAPTRALGYARVSSEEQARGNSLDDQQRAIRAYAEARGLIVAELFVEAESAVLEKLERRVEMQRLMATARRGDLVLCDKLDRWSRDPEFSYRSVRELLERGCHIYFIADRIDPSTPEGDSAMSFRILFAREEHKRIKERLVGTRKLLRDRGYYADGTPPFGYRRRAPKGHRDPEKNILRIEEDEAATVRRVFALAGSGVSLAKIAEAVGLERTRVHKIVRTRTYLGEILDTSGAWIAGKHAPIVDPATWLRANDAVASRRYGGPRPRTGRTAETDAWVLRDVAVCGLCGARMGAAYAGTPEARRYYYRCAHACTTRYVRVERAEDDFAPMVLVRLADIRVELARPPSTPSLPDPAEGVEAKRAKLAAKRARYLEMYAEGLLEHAAMREAVAKVDVDLLRLAAAPPPRPLDDPAARRSALARVDVLEKAWLASGSRRRREVATLLAHRVGLAAGQEPAPTWRTVHELGLDVA